MTDSGPLCIFLSRYAFTALSVFGIIVTLKLKPFPFQIFPDGMYGYSKSDCTFLCS